MPLQLQLGSTSEAGDIRCGNAKAARCERGVVRCGPGHELYRTRREEQGKRQREFSARFNPTESLDPYVGGAPPEIPGKPDDGIARVARNDGSLETHALVRGAGGQA